jgi:hypothetical protein
MSHRFHKEMPKKPSDAKISAAEKKATKELVNFIKDICLPGLLERFEDNTVPIQLTSCQKIMESKDDDSTKLDRLKKTAQRAVKMTNTTDDKVIGFFNLLNRNDLSVTELRSELMDFMMTIFNEKFGNTEEVEADATDEEQSDVTVSDTIGDQKDEPFDINKYAEEEHGKHRKPYQIFMPSVHPIAEDDEKAEDNDEEPPQSPRSRKTS